jgi:hypothetical protein
MIDMPVNSFKRGLAEGRAQIGLWLSLADPYCAELCAGAGFVTMVLPTNLPLPMEYWDTLYSAICFMRERFRMNVKNLFRLVTRGVCC